MRRQLWGAALLAAGFASQAGAVNTEGYKVPYFGFAYDHVVTDSSREAGDGQGFQVTFGVPMENPRSAIEMRFFDHAITDRFPDDKDDYQTGILVDFVHDYGTVFDETGIPVLSTVKPFASAGVGFIQEDVLGDKHMHLGLNVGGGLLIPIGWKGWAVRLDGRVQPQSNSDSVPDQSSLIDYVFNLGIQIPMTLFFDRPVAVEPEPECPVAVVDPETGRKDCAADSDKDGVDDSIDECPGTPAGSKVDKRGCPEVAKVSTDEDGDGVENDDDKCAGTQKGLRVNDEGCVVAQKTSLAGVTFQPNSDKLTGVGRTTLDGVAATLKGQDDLKVEIAGHTDSVGSEAYNTLLSQRRADSVRAYLTSKGIEAARMTAVGYGESEPVASNDSEDGRRTNRRVEFRITTD